MEMKWIPVNKGRPDYGEDVLVFDGSAFARGWLDRERGWQSFDEDIVEEAVTHWTRVKLPEVLR